MTALIAALFLLPKSVDSAGTICIEFWQIPNADPPCIIKTPVYRNSNTIFRTIEIGKAVRADIDFSFSDQYTKPDTSRQISAGHYYDPSKDEYDDYPEPFRLNNDDDNANGILDNYELKTSATDNDLIPVELGYWLREDAYMNDFIAEIVVSNNSAVRLWYWKNTFREITPGQQWRLEDLPKEIFIDPIKPASNLQITLQVRSVYTNGYSLFSDRYVPGNFGSADTTDQDTISFSIDSSPQDQSLTEGDPLVPGTTENPLVYSVQSADMMLMRTFSTRIYAKDDDSSRNDLRYEITRVQEVLEELEMCNSCYLDCRGDDTGSVCAPGETCIASQDRNRLIDQRQQIYASCWPCTGDDCKQDCTECSAECVSLPGLCAPGEVCAHDTPANDSASCAACNNNQICEPELGETCASCSKDCLGSTAVCGADELCSVALYNDKTECRPCNNDNICQAEESCQCPDCHGEAKSCSNGQDCRNINEANPQLDPLFLCGTCGDFKCNAGTLYDVPNFQSYFTVTPQSSVAGNNWGIFRVSAFKNIPISPKPTQSRRTYRIDVKVSDAQGNSGTTQFDLTIHNYNWSRPTGSVNPSAFLGEERPEYFTHGGTNLEFEYYHDSDLIPKRKQEGYITTQGHDFASNPSRYYYKGGDFDFDEQTNNSGHIIRVYSTQHFNADGYGPSVDQYLEFQRSIGFQSVGFVEAPVYAFEDKPVNSGSPFRDSARIRFNKQYYSLDYGHYLDVLDDEDEGHPIGDVQAMYFNDQRSRLAINPIDDEVEPPSSAVLQGRLEAADAVAVDQDVSENELVYTTKYIPHTYTFTRTPRAAERFEYTNLNAPIIEEWNIITNEKTYNYDDSEHGNFVYVPREGYEGLDSFAYKLLAVRGGNVRDIPPNESGGGTVPPDTAFCGDGITRGIEQCDDGKLLNGSPESDCTMTCMRKECDTNADCRGVCFGGQCYGECESDAECFGGQECVSLQCRPLCGNGRIDGLEQCDDGSINSQAESNCRGDCTLKECQTDDECLTREQCIANTCIDTTQACTDNGDCTAPDECIAGYCRDPFVVSSSSSSSVATSSVQSSTGSSISSDLSSSSVSSVSSSQSSGPSYPRTDLYSCPLY